MAEQQPSLPGLTRQSITDQKPPSIFLLMDARIKSGHDEVQELHT
jgi:hypothetical protein